MRRGMRQNVRNGGRERRGLIGPTPGDLPIVLFALNSQLHNSRRNEPGEAARAVCFEHSIHLIVNFY